MASLNKVFLMGNLTRDPELRYTPSGAAVATFGLAINRKFKQGDDWKDEICFVDITVWSKMAENCAEFLSKGRGVMVEGRLSFRSWEGQDGQKRSKLDVVASNVQFLPRGGSGETHSGQQSNGLKTAPPAPPENDSAPNFVQEDDVPF